MINLIAAVGEKYELGKDNKLIWDLPNDLKFFKETTLNKVIVMGRKTFESIGRPLPKRTNVVITNNTEFNYDNVIVYNNLDNLLNDFKDEEIFIIGGSSIYNQFINVADKIYLTEIESSCSDADSFFPTFDKTKYIREVLKTNEDNGIKYTHVLYIKK